jgi:PelA/Pel-15E family pectate lyase
VPGLLANATFLFLQPMKHPWPRFPATILAVIGISLPALAAGADWRKLLAQPEPWFASAAGQVAVSNVLSWQSLAGGWPKNEDTTRTTCPGDPAKLTGTFDNGATTGEMRFLARAFAVTGDVRCRDAVHKALDHVLAAQYPTGGWPQRHPPGNQYHRHITFNDGTMVRLLELLQEVDQAPDFAFLGAPRRAAARGAFQRGVECILRCQVTVDGRLTVWCAQHDEVNFQPRPGRAYELATLSGSESAGILAFLMRLDRRSPEINRAIEAGAAWFAAVKLSGIRVNKVGGDRVVVPDPEAAPLWARFYDLETGRPVFCGRDGVKQFSLAEIDRERRNGYAWYGNWGESVARDFAAWKQHALTR